MKRAFVYYTFYYLAVMGLIMGGVLMVSNPYWAILPMFIGIVSLLAVTEGRWNLNE